MSIIEAGSPDASMQSAVERSDLYAIKDALAAGRIAMLADQRGTDVAVVTQAMMAVPLSEAAGPFGSIGDAEPVGGPLFERGYFKTT